MATELENLRVQLEADTTKLERAMKRADGAVKRYGKNTDRSLQRTEKRFERHAAKLNASLVGIGAALVGAFSGQAIDRVARANNSMADLADTVGFSTQRFQELQTLLLDQGMGLNEFEGAMKTFAVRMGELRAETGGFYLLLKNHLPTLANQLKVTKDQNEAFTVMARAFGQIPSAADRAAIANQAFGKRALQLISVLEGGEKTLMRGAELAREYGTVVSEEAIKGTRQLQREFDLLGRSITAAFAEGVGENASFIVRTLTALREAIQDFNAEAKADGLRFLPVEQLGLKDLEAASKIVSDELAKLRATIDKPADQRSWLGFLDKTIVEATGQAEHYEQRLAAIQARMQALNAIAAAGSLRGGTFESTANATPGLGLQTKTSTSKANSAPSIAPFVTTIENDAQRAFDIMERARESQQALADEFRANTSGIASAIESNLAQPLDDAFSGNLQSVQQYFKQLLADLAKAIIKATILKTIMGAVTGGGGAGIGALGSVFGGFFANGGPVTANRPVVVGERGPELFTPSTSGMITRNDAIQPTGGLAPSSPMRSQTIHVSGLRSKDLFTGDMVRDFAEQLLDYQRDGGRVVLNTR